MEQGFWVGLFAFLGVIVTAVATHLKNVQQDKAALKRDFRINTLEAQHEQCERERVRLLEQINTLLHLRSNGKPDAK